MEDHASNLSPAARAVLHRLLCSPDAPAEASDELRLHGWLCDAGRLRPEAAVLLGCDVGGTKTQSVLADLSGRVLAEVKEPTAAAGGLSVIDQIAAQRNRLLHIAGIDPARLRAAAIGMPAAVHPRTGRLSRIPNIAGVEDLDLAAVLSRELALPVVVENDVNLAAQGEHWLGHRAESMVFIALGTGIGMGIILNDQLVRGAHGAAGEISALPIGADAFDPRTFATGALESVISGKALLASHIARGGQPGRSLRDLFKTPDAAFAGVQEDLARLLALAVLSVAAVIDPAQVVLGGSIGSRPELLPRLQHHLDRCMNPAPPCRISALGNRAGVLGAVWSARLLLARQIASHSPGINHV